MLSSAREQQQLKDLMLDVELAVGDVLVHYQCSNTQHKQFNPHPICGNVVAFLTDGTVSFEGELTEHENMITCRQCSDVIGYTRDLRRNAYRRLERMGLRPEDYGIIW